MASHPIVEIEEACAFADAASRHVQAQAVMRRLDDDVARAARRLVVARPDETDADVIARAGRVAMERLRAHGG